MVNPAKVLFGVFGGWSAAKQVRLTGLGVAATSNAAACSWGQGLYTHLNHSQPEGQALMPPNLLSLLPSVLYSGNSAPSLYPACPPTPTCYLTSSFCALLLTLADGGVSSYNQPIRTSPQSTSTLLPAYHYPLSPVLPISFFLFEHLSV
ncbi:MAG: hypothetical protein M1820_003391 [Bogoriella megaspora]|nr:MAG: hypothetical protein M1820_003391 [Bogoriella megaspora]